MTDPPTLTAPRGLPAGDDKAWRCGFGPSTSFVYTGKFRDPRISSVDMHANSESEWV